MSTLLTPIITQMELDRDRLKVLVNGEVDDTVQLEFRIEKSIAGMVKERIDELAYSLERAIELATDARDEAILSANEAEEAKEVVEGIAQNVVDNIQSMEQIKEKTEDFKNESQKYRDDSQFIYSEILGLQSGDNGVVFPPKAIHPSDNYEGEDNNTNIIPYNNNEFHLYARYFATNSNSIQFIEREFLLVKMDSDFSGEYEDIHDGDGVDDGGMSISKNFTEVLRTKTKDDSLYLNTQTVDDSWYAWRATDYYKNTNPNAVVSLSQGDWVLFKINATTPYITRPVVSISEKNTLTPTINITGGQVKNSTDQISHTHIMIYDRETNTPVYVKTLVGDKSSHKVEGGFLKYSGSYKVKVQNYIENSDDRKPNLYSPFSAFVNFEPDVDISYLPFYHTKSEVTNSIIDVENSTVYRVDASVDRTLTLSKATLPSNTAASIVIFIEDSGGTITWPTEVSWSGGSEPTLGTSWTNVMLFWTGSMWIGMEGAKR